MRITQELEHVNHYVGIEQVRFPDITIAYDIREEDFLVSALSVQHLVENAIKHGLIGLESGGKVRITTYETEEAYCVDAERIDCDYYSFLKNGKPEFFGEYITQYSWAEGTCGLLENH